MTLDEVHEHLKRAFTAAVEQRLSPEMEDYRLASVEALSEQFAGACYQLAGGDPDLLKTIYDQHSGKALAVITLLVEVVNGLPGGGFPMRDIWEEAFKAIDEG